LSAHFKDKVEKIEQIITKITEESAKGKPIIVEGKKDAKALQELGVSGPIMTVKTGGKSFLQATMEIETLDTAEVILLLDFDRRGKEGTERLQQSLERSKIKVNRKFWLELRALGGHEIQCIESLTSYLYTIHKKSDTFKESIF